MAHLIESYDNILYHERETPWHDIGTAIPENTNFNIWCQKAFPWKYEERSVNLADGTEIPNYKAIQRTDTQEVLNIVSDGFKVVQPQEIMEFFRNLLDTDLFAMETAGSLKNGRRIWALARHKSDPICIKGQDLLLPYLLLATSVDGTLSTTATFTAIRTVCWNTLSVAVNGNDTVRIPHSATFDPNHVKAQLGLIDSQFEAFSHSLELLSDYKISDADAIKFLYETIGDKTRKLEDQPRTFASIVSSIHNSPGANLRSAKNTLWGVVNGVSHYTDHQANERAQGNRLNSAWFGANANLKSKVFNEALRLAA